MIIKIILKKYYFNEKFLRKYFWGFLVKIIENKLYIFLQNYKYNKIYYNIIRYNIIKYNIIKLN